jgi:hypothetical protein
VPDSEGAHIARLDERVEGVRQDLAEVVAEMAKTRKRLHDLEGIAQAFMDVQRDNRRKEADQYRKLVIWLQIVAVLVAIAAIIVPVVVLVTIGK